MKRNRHLLLFSACCLSLSNMGIVNAMGLRSFVALPVEKGGAVMRISYVNAQQASTDTLDANAAYGISAKQTLLLGLPYRLSPAGSNQQGDLSLMYRHIVWQQDSLEGTNRLGLLGGAVVPTESDREAAIQAGFVFTRFRNRHELDIDALYQQGLENRIDRGRYDVSWQYRLTPETRPDWGIGQELNSVLELNGRWSEGNSITHQITLGLQWINQKLVVEGGVFKDLNNAAEIGYIASMRFHF